MVFYRKYRPKKIAELDSEEVREKLYSILSSIRSFDLSSSIPSLSSPSTSSSPSGLSPRDERLSGLGVEDLSSGSKGRRTHPSELDSVPHAFLFTGPKGLGKTSAARIVAKVLNCEKNIKYKTKNLKKQSEVEENENIEPCNECTQCTSINSGTNLDVLEIDAASNRGIDEIRDLREKIKLAPISANKKIYIIDEVHMLTTEAFNALLKTLEEPPAHVVFILCTTEPQKIPATIDSRCFHIIFKLATKEELMRSFKRIVDEEKLLIDEDALLHMANFSEGSFRDGVKILEEIILTFHGKKVTKELIEQKYKTTNINYQIDGIINFLVEKETKPALKLVAKLVEEGIDFKYFIEKLIFVLHEMLLIKTGVKVNSRPKDDRLMVEALEIGEIKILIELLSKAYGELKYAVLPQLPLEMTIIEWNLKENKTEEKKEEIQNNLTSTLASYSKKEIPVDGKNDNSDMWYELIKKIKPYNHSVAGVLRGCVLKKYDEKVFIIEAGYKFHKERLEERKTDEILRKVLEEITGEKIKVVVELKK